MNSKLYWICHCMPGSTRTPTSASCGAAQRGPEGERGESQIRSSVSLLLLSCYSAKSSLTSLILLFLFFLGCPLVLLIFYAVFCHFFPEPYSWFCQSTFFHSAFLFCLVFVLLLLWSSVCWVLLASLILSNYCECSWLDIMELSGCQTINLALVPGTLKLWLLVGDAIVQQPTTLKLNRICTLLNMLGKIYKEEWGHK